MIKEIALPSLFCVIIMQQKILMISFLKETLMNYLDIYIFFIIYSFLGWFCETIYCSTLQKKLINRGFVTGPFCPIYGFGALAILKMLSPFTDNFLVIYLAGIFITSLLEYVSSYLLEVTFDTHWWDYSSYRFNIKGRVCLRNSLMFGGLAAALHFYIHPFVEQNVLKIDPVNLQYFALSFTLVFAIDFVHAINTILSLNLRLKRLEAIRADLALRSADLAQGLNIGPVLTRVKKLRLRSITEFETVEDVYKTFYSKLTNLRFAEKRLIQAFPRMKNRSIPYIEAMREYVSEKREKKEESVEK